MANNLEQATEDYLKGSGPLVPVSKNDEKKLLDISDDDMDGSSSASGPVFSTETLGVIEDKLERLSLRVVSNEQLEEFRQDFSTHHKDVIGAISALRRDFQDMADVVRKSHQILKIQYNAEKGNTSKLVADCSEEKDLSVRPLKNSAPDDASVSSPPKRFRKSNGFAGRGGHRQSHGRSEAPSNSENSTNPYSCSFCDKVGHESITCQIYTTYTARKEVLDRKKLCLKCFKHPRTSVCRVGTLKCAHCGLDHAKALCNQYN